MLTSSRKSQASIEFMGVLSFALLVFGVFSVLMVSHRSDIEAHNSFLEIKKVAKEASSIINIACLEGDGYSIKLSVPYYVNNRDYNLTIQNGSVQVEQEGSVYEAPLFTEDITGSFKKGDNIIRNINGVIRIE